MFGLRRSRVNANSLYRSDSSIGEGSAANQHRRDSITAVSHSRLRSRLAKPRPSCRSRPCPPRTKAALLGGPTRRRFVFRTRTPSKQNRAALNPSSKTTALRQTVTPGASVPRITEFPAHCITCRSTRRTPAMPCFTVRSAPAGDTLSSALARRCSASRSVKLRSRRSRVNANSLSGPTVHDPLGLGPRHGGPRSCQLPMRTCTFLRSHSEIGTGGDPRGPRAVFAPETQMPVSSATLGN